MKRSLKTLMVAVCAVILASMIGCSKTEKLIIGTWDAEKAISTITISGSGTAYDGTRCDTIIYVEGQASMTFKDDNTMTASSLNMSTGEKEVSNATYAIDDDKLTITYGNDVSEYTIMDIDKSNMQLRSTMDETQGQASMKAVIDLYLKKK